MLLSKPRARAKFLLIGLQGEGRGSAYKGHAKGSAVRQKAH